MLNSEKSTNGNAAVNDSNNSADSSAQADRAKLGTENHTLTHTFKAKKIMLIFNL